MGWIQAAIAAAGAIGGGALGSSGAKSASKAEQKGLQQQLALQQWMYQNGVQMNEPWRATGQSALNNLAKLYGHSYYDYQAPDFAGAPGVGGGGGSSGSKNFFAQPQFGKYTVMGHLFGGGSSQPQGTISAKQVVSMLKQGMSVDQIGKIGQLVIHKPGSATKRLTKAGLSGDQIAGLLNPQLGAQEDFESGYHEGTGQADMSVFTNSPDYQFRRDEGTRDIGNSFAARGGAFSGNALRGLNDFNSGLASQEFGNYFNRQAALAGIGQTATNNANTLGMNFANQGGNALANMGDARASGIANQANIWGNALGGAANAFGQWYGNRNPYQNTGSSPYGRGA